MLFFAARCLLSDTVGGTVDLDCQARESRAFKWELDVVVDVEHTAGTELAVLEVGVEGFSNPPMAKEVAEAARTGRRRPLDRTIF